jgi:hypothetical protein
MWIARAGLGGLLTFLAAAAAAQPAATDDAGNRMTPLPIVAAATPEEQESRSALHCNAGRDFCLRARRDGESGPWFLEFHEGPSAHAAAPVRRLPLPAGEDPDSELFQIWPHLVPEASGATLIGLERYRRAGFSGGGAGATELLLLRLPSGGGEPEQVLAVQIGYTATIRACFSRADHRRLGDACHQQLEFSATLGLEPSAAAGRPRFAFVAAARNYPRGSQVEGWESRPLRRADRVWEADPACSYRRTFAFDPASGRYAADRPPPDCSLYSLP